LSALMVFRAIMRRWMARSWIGALLRRRRNWALDWLSWGITTSATRLSNMLITGATRSSWRNWPARPEADYIVFCGVHFMAESADILSGPHQKVILPNPAAGCSMADMANIAEVLDCWAQLVETLGPEQGIVPVTYMNSAAALKAFCGRNGGIVCTSSNARQVLRWALERGRKILFFPDQNLGRNTALAMGYSLDDMVVWAPGRDLGGNPPEALERATFILWKGHCSVHGRFRPEQIL